MTITVSNDIMATTYGQAHEIMTEQLADMGFTVVGSVNIGLAANIIVTSGNYYAGEKPWYYTAEVRKL